jgi:Ycf66 protein N-terminus
MLAYILSVIVGTGSVGLYLAAFLFPEVHRSKDIFWSGLGLFYALVLWVNGTSLGGGLLLGQALSVVLLSWFTWETLSLRRAIIPENQRTPLPPIPNFDLSAGRKAAALQLESDSIIDDLSAAFDDPIMDPITPGASEAIDSEEPWISIQQEFPPESEPAPPSKPNE